MRITRYLFITLAATTTVFGQPVISAIVNAGSGLVNASPGCMEAIYGSNLAPTAADAPAGNLPTTLNGVTVTVGGIAAPLKYVSPGQINFQVPFEATGSTASVVVNSGSSSIPFALSLSTFSPGLISIDPTHALVIGPDFQLKSTVHAGDAIILYAVGLGPTGPPTPTGAAGNSQEPLNRVVFVPTLTIGGRMAPISFAGMAPGFPGIYQINATVPSTPLDNSLTLAIDAVSSSSVVSFANGNVSNVTASANLLYPLSTSLLTYSPVTVISSYSASFDMAANAQPFTIFAQASAGSSTLTVDPRARTFTITSTVPTILERMGNFSQSGLPGIDFLNNSRPLPGNIIPTTRIDLLLITAEQNVPLPNVATLPGLGEYTSTGPLPPGAHFTTDPSLTVFGGLITFTTEPPSHTVSASVALYVDGMPVDNESVTAKTP